MIETLIQRWRQLAGRERRMLVFAALFACVASVYLLLIEPALQGRDEIESGLPRLREQVAEADLLVGEARRLASAAANTPRPSLQSVRLSVEQSLEAAGLRGSLQQIQASDSLIDLRFRNVLFSAWLNWLDATVRQARLRVADVTVTRETEAGMVSVRVVLELAGSERR
jgi:general secretion pathway protein M